MTQTGCEHVQHSQLGWQPLRFNERSIGFAAGDRKRRNSRSLLLAAQRKKVSAGIDAKFAVRTLAIGYDAIRRDPDIRRNHL